MAKVVFQLGALGLEPVVVVVCDLPSFTRRLRHVHPVVSRQPVLGEPALVRQLFACVGMAPRALKPRDREGIVTTAQAAIVDGAPQRPCRASPLEAAACVRSASGGGLPKRSALKELGRGVGGTGKEEGATRLSHPRTKGLVALEVLAQEGATGGRELRGMRTEPALARLPFPGLVAMPGVWPEGRRRQGHDLRLAGADAHRGDRGMLIESLAMGELTPAPVGAMNGCGGKRVGAIEGHQQLRL